jgi:type I restriction enzyme S subunit
MKASATREQIIKFTLRACDTIITKDSEDTNDIAVPTYVPETIKDVICGYHLALIRPFVSRYGAFIKRNFETSYAKAYFGTMANGLTRYGLGTYALANAFFIQPPLKEAVTITAFLDHETAKIDTLIEKQQKLIALLKEKRQAVISHAVTKGLNPDAPMKDSGVEWLGEVPAHWEIMKLSHFAVFKSGDGIISDQIKSEGRYPVYGGNGVRGYFEKFNHDGNYVLVGRQGALCGNINFGEGKFWASEHAIVVYPTRKVGFKWLGSVLKTMNLNQYSISAAQPGLSIDNITCLKAPVPPLSEQQEIGRLIHKEKKRFDILIDKTQRSIDLSKERRTALISAAVTGKIDVRDWQPPPPHKEIQ